MPYGTPKLSAPTLLDAIVGVIRDHLLKNNAFSNSSLGYYGASFQYVLEVQLVARQETELEISGDTAVSDENTSPVDIHVAVQADSVGDSDMTKVHGETVAVTEVTVQGKHSAGTLKGKEQGKNAKATR